MTDFEQALQYVKDNVEQIDRGYEAIEERLNALGAKITRE